MDYLRAIGHSVFAYLWAKMAKVALDQGAAPGSFYAAKLATARVYYQRLLPEVETCIQSALAGANGLFALDAEAFGRS